MAKLDNNSAQFVTQVSKQTGIDPRVLVAWILAEGAYAPGGTGGYNYLNLRPATGDVGVSKVTSGNFDNFRDVNSAVASTVNRLNQPFAAPILQSRGGTPRRQIAGIAATGWDSGHYGGSGGPNLVADFERIFGKGSANSGYVAPSAASAVAATANTGSAADWTSSAGGTSSAPGSSGSGLLPGVGAINSVGDFLGKLTDPSYLLRGLQIVAGGVLVLVGVVLLARQVGLAADVPSPAAALANATPVGKASTVASSSVRKRTASSSRTGYGGTFQTPAGGDQHLSERRAAVRRAPRKRYTEDLSRPAKPELRPDAQSDEVPF